MTTSSRASLLAAGLAALALLATPAPVGADGPSPRSAPRTVLDVSALETGAPPAIAWSERRAGKTVIHGPDGTTTPVPNNLVELAPMGSGYVIQTALNRPVTVRWVAADGTPGRSEWRTGYNLAVSPQGKAVAFAGSRGRVWTIDQEGDRVFRYNRLPATGTPTAVTMSGENCKEGEGDPGFGCSIVVNGARAWYTTSHGIVDRVPHLRLASTGRGRWLGGITTVSEMGSCSAMLRSWDVRWTTCDNRFSDISTDNRHVLGLPSYGDGSGPNVLDLLATADGSVVHSFVSARNGHSATYFEEVWEDAEHVLVVTYQDGEWAVVRLGLDGAMEYAVEPQRTSMDRGTPFQLQTR